VGNRRREDQQLQPRASLNAKHSARAHLSLELLLAPDVGDLLVEVGDLGCEIGQVLAIAPFRGESRKPVSMALHWIGSRLMESSEPLTARHVSRCRRPGRDTCERRRWECKVSENAAQIPKRAAARATHILTCEPWNHDPVLLVWRQISWSPLPSIAKGLRGLSAACTRVLKEKEAQPEDARLV
jgi:hypothetical protein